MDDKGEKLYAAYTAASEDMGVGCDEFHALDEIEQGVWDLLAERLIGAGLKLEQPRDF